MKNLDVKILPLDETTAEEFAPYGQVMRREEGEPYESLEHLKYWTKNTDLGPDNDKVDGGLLVCNKNGRNIKYFERHPETAEFFVLIEGECLFLMAPSDNSRDKPDISRAKAFFMNGKLGAGLHKGTWHWPPIPLGETCKFVLVRKGTLWETTEIKELGELGIDKVNISL